MTATTNGQQASPQGQTRWDRFLYWSNRFYQSEEFDKFEREYKIVIVSRLEQAKSDVFKSDPTWIEKLNYAITTPPNNLTNWRATQPYLAWCRSEPDNASLAHRLLWDDDATVTERFDRFLEVVATSGKNILIAEASFLHSAMGPHAFPIFRATPVDRAMEFTGYPTLKDVGIKTGELGRRYEYFLQFLDIMLKRASDSGIHFRDRLDAQSAMWMVTQWGPVDTWSEPDKQAFLAYQGNPAERNESWPSQQ